MVLMGDPKELERLGIKPGQPMSEADLQRNVFKILRANQVHCWPVPNNKAARRTAGFVPGVADVHILHNGEFFALELKVGNNTPDDNQHKFIQATHEAGGYSFWSRGWDNTYAVLKGWGLV